DSRVHPLLAFISPAHPKVGYQASLRGGLQVLEALLCLFDWGLQILCSILQRASKIRFLVFEMLLRLPYASLSFCKRFLSGRAPLGSFGVGFERIDQVSLQLGMSSLGDSLRISQLGR